MKWNAKAAFSAVLEYVILLVPSIGYSVYSYVATMQSVLTETQKGTFWATFSLTISIIIIVAISHSRFKTIYCRYTQAYVQQKADLEINPTNEMLIEKVAQKAKIIETLDWVAVAFGMLITVILLYTLRGVIDEAISILGMVTLSIFGKIGLHNVTIYLKANGMKSTTKTEVK